MPAVEQLLNMKEYNNMMSELNQLRFTLRL